MAVVPNRTRVHENGFLSLSISYLCLRCCEKDVCAPPQNSYMNTRSPMGWCEQAGPLGEVRPRDRDPRERD